MRIKTRAIVISNLKFGDNGLIVHCYTEQHGRVALLFKGVHNKRGKIKASMLMPLTLLELEVSYSEKRELQFAREVSVLHSMINLHGDPIKNSVAIFLSEVLSKTLKEQEANGLLFQFLANSMAYLNEVTGVARALFHLKFMLELSRFLGFYPENNYDLITTHFSAETGCFISKPRDLVEDASTGKLIHDLLRLNFEQIETLQVVQQTTKLALEKIVTLYISHSTGISEFKSYTVFRDL